MPRADVTPRHRRASCASHDFDCSIITRSLAVAAVSLQALRMQLISRLGVPRDGRKVRARLWRASRAAESLRGQANNSRNEFAAAAAVLLGSQDELYSAEKLSSLDLQLYIYIRVYTKGAALSWCRDRPCKCKTCARPAPHLQGDESGANYAKQARTTPWGEGKVCSCLSRFHIFKRHSMLFQPSIYTRVCVAPCVR